MQLPEPRIIKHFCILEYISIREQPRGGGGATKQNETKTTYYHTQLTRSLDTNRHSCAGEDAGEGESLTLLFNYAMIQSASAQIRNSRVLPEVPGRQFEWTEKQTEGLF